MTSTVVDALNTTLDDIMSSRVPPELRPAAFAVVLARRLEGPAEPPRPATKASSDRSDDGSSSPFDSIARKFGIRSDQAADAFHIVDGTVEIQIPVGRIDSSAAGGTRQLALMISASRQAAELEQTTAIETIRECCIDFNRYSQGNFAATINGIDEIKVAGKGADRSVRVLRPGFAKAGELVTTLLGAA